MDLEVPPWLNAEFLEKVLQEGDESRKVKVVTFSAKSALPPGDNFSSHLFRTKVEYTLNAAPAKEITLIIKAPITKGVISQMQGEMDLYAAEPQVYQELLPRLQKKVGCEFGPKSHPCQAISRVMVLQDLKSDGFTLCDRLKQLDFEHCKVALSSLAKFHAASVACFHDDPEFIKEIGKERFYSNPGFVGQMQFMFQLALKNVAAMLKENKESEQVADYLVGKADTFMQSLARIAQPREGFLNVINHGDFWMSNMLFKRDGSGKVVDVKFIDFQAVRYTSPAPDILYFIFTSANEEARSRQRELLDVYLKTFNSSLESLGCEERLVSAQLDEEFKNCKDWAALTMCTVLSMVLNDPENVPNVEEMTEEDFKSGKPFEVVFKSKRFKEELPKVAKHFQKVFLS